MISAVWADDLKPVGVAAFGTAIHDADRLTAQDRLAAVAGPPGERGCHNSLELNGSATGHGDYAGAVRRPRPDGISHDVIRVGCALLNQLTARKLVPGHYRRLEQRRRLSLTVALRPYAGHAQPSRIMPDSRGGECTVSEPHGYSAMTERRAALPPSSVTPPRLVFSRAP